MPTPPSQRAVVYADEHSDAPDLTVVLPCLNEARTLGACVETIKQTFSRANIHGEIIVADNGSSDGSIAIAEARGARVIHVDRKGYGSAIMGGIAAAQSKYILMGDCDESYDFTHIPRYLKKLNEGYDVVLGNRFLGGIAPGAMPALHRYFGNPVLSFLGRMLFHTNCGDLQCGMRAINKMAYQGLAVHSTGMEFASEMVVKASLMGLRITEVPTTLRPDKRGRESHLRTWRDGWRHLRLMLLYCPRSLFLYPGAFLIIAGLAATIWLLPHARTVHGIAFDVHTLLYSMIAIFIGFQAVRCIYKGLWSRSRISPP